jgi:hypothetical protein
MYGNKKKILKNEEFSPFLGVEDKETFRATKLGVRQSFLSTEGDENDLYFRRLFRNFCLKFPRDHKFTSFW